MGSLMAHLKIIAIAVLLTLCLAPIIVALFSSWLLGEKLTPSLIIALGFALTGTALLVGVSAVDAIASINALIGILLALTSAFAYAIVVLCSRALAGRCHPLQSLTISFSTAAVILLPFAFLNGLAITYPIIGWALLLYLGLVPTVFAYLLFLSAIRQTTATVASITTLLEPLTSTILAWWFFHEQLGLFGLWGGLLLLVAMLLLLRSGRENN